LERDRAKPELAASDTDRCEGTESMEFMRVVHATETRWVLSQDDGLCWLDGDPFGEWQRGEEVCSLAAVRFLPPCTPSKIVAVGRNYRDHVEEMGSQLPEEPLFFLKPPSSILGHRESIVYPTELTQRVDYEGELAVVIGRRGRHIPVEEALDYVLGYTCANDVTARDLQRRDDQWTRAKGFDTFCPLGPVIRTGLDPRALTIVTRVNGEIRQSGSTSKMVFSVDVLLSAISQVMTLEPGDVLLTGTPSGVGELRDGDVVEVEIEGIGTLANPVEAA
jgi:2-keto-4-pentenoate hydratase/2-oxohepta-3-ene-1,7-dioic acid hydratase in catechol pathway